MSSGTAANICSLCLQNGALPLVEPGNRPLVQYGRVPWRRTETAGAVLDDALVPPQNLDAEESVLGAMMLSPGASPSVSEILSSDGREFYRESHAKIYRAALGLYAKGEPVDAITLADELDERSELENVGGKFRIHELASVAPATANAHHYAQIVRETATLRGLIRAGGDIARSAGTARARRPSSSTRRSRSSSTSPSSGPAASSATSRSS